MSDQSHPTAAEAAQAAAERTDEPVVEDPPTAMVHTGGQPDSGTQPAAAVEVATNGTGEPVKGEVLDLDDFVVLPAKLGGRPFLAKEPSIKTQKALIRGGGEADVPDEDLDDDVTVEEALESLKSLNTVYPQIAQVLRHADGEEQGEPPSREFVEEHIRISTFQKLFRRLLGGRAEGEDSDA